MSRKNREKIAHNRSAVDVARAFGGALFFSLPLLMTMEMWWLGFYMDRLRLALFLFLLVPVLTFLSHHAGIHEHFRWGDDVRDAFTALAIGFITAAAVLFLFGLLRPKMSLGEVIGKISLQAVPASIGAMLARSQLGSKRLQITERREQSRFSSELFIMSVGAVFFAFNVAPTEEMVLIAYKMTGWHLAALALTSLFLLHAFVYKVEFRGHEAVSAGTPLWSVFARFTVVGYAISLVISLYILWTFGRLDGLSFAQGLEAIVVLAFPASLGAAAARLVL